MDRSQGDDRELIGFAEYVELPDWGIRGLRAKVDTGARSSALHVESIEHLPGDRVCFDVVVNRRTNRRVHVVTEIKRIGHVRSSSGSSEVRYFVATRMRLGRIVKEIEISLAARHAMQFRMLLGRSALGHDFVIDAGKRYVHGRPADRRRGTSKKTSKGRKHSRP